MKTKFIGNPYYAYIYSFGLALFIYSWGWSDLYPSLTIEVISFLSTTFIIALLLGKSIEQSLIYNKIPISDNNIKIVTLIIIGYILEFIHHGGIPILNGLLQDDFTYMGFGIPTFHVGLHTFCTFYTVYIFHQYISSRKKYLLVLVFILIIPSYLIINRGAIVMTLSGCLIIYLLDIRKILINRIAILLISAIVFFYGFGYLGNSRSFSGDSRAVTIVFDATDEFKEGLVPNEYFWFYIYASSPIASFQNATILPIKHRYDIGAFIAWELLPDFVSKRIIAQEADYDRSHRLEYSVHFLLTVGSMYFVPFIRLGWYGPIIMFLSYALLLYIYIAIFPKNSKYFITGISTLCVLSIFSMFENMLNFPGLILQAFYPMVISLLDKHNIRFIGFPTRPVWIYLFRKKVRIL